MAIALDASSVSTDQTTTGYTWSHTCTGSNLILAVGVLVYSVDGSPTATGVTYNGVAMTKARADTIISVGNAHIETSVWLLFNPATGAHNVAVSFTAGSIPHSGGAAASYTGAQQSSTADAVNGSTGTTTGAKTVNVTTVADNSWVFGIGANVASSAPTMAATNTSRQTLTFASSLASILRIEDTNGPKTPAGAQDSGFTVGAGVGEAAYAITAASFAPISSTAINTTQSVTVTESKNLQVDSFINTSDSVSVSENVSVQIDPNTFASTSDNVSVSESVNVFLPFYSPNVVENTTVSESVNIVIGHNINKSESISVTEVPVLSTPTPPLKPWTAFSDITKPVDSYGEAGKNTASFTEATKPAGSYTDTSKPTAAYSEATKPLTPMTDA